MAKRRIHGDSVLEAARAGQSGEPLELELFGEVHELPAELPAAVLIGFSRMAAGDGTGLDMALETLLGRDVVDQCVEHGLGFNALVALLESVTKAYGVTLGESSGSLEPSKTTSTSSTPTSPGTTE